MRPFDPAALAPSGVPSPSFTDLVWEDDFNGAAGEPPNPAIRTPRDKYANAGQLAINRKGNALMDGSSHLQVIAKQESYEGYSYTCCELESRPGYGSVPAFSFLYGRLEARIQVPEGFGLWPAFWMLGEEEGKGGQTWPTTGEIDIMEMWGESQFAVNHSTLHGGPTSWSTSAQCPAAWAGASNFAAAFHDYAVIWTAAGIWCTVDGVVSSYKTANSMPGGQTWPFTGQKFFVVFSIEVGGLGGEPVTAAFPATMLVDWVRVYQ